MTALFCIAALAWSLVIALPVAAVATLFHRFRKTKPAYGQPTPALTLFSNWFSGTFAISFLVLLVLFLVLPHGRP